MNDIPNPMEQATREQQHRDAQFAMRLSLIAGVLMLAGKMSAFLLTDSSAIFSDAAESVVHVVAVAFAVFQSLAEHTTRGAEISVWLRKDRVLLRRF